LECDEELLEVDSLASEEDYDDDTTVSPSSRPGFVAFRGSQQQRCSKYSRALDKASGVIVDSSTESNCSTPRSADSESLPWHDGPRSSAASSASGAPWQERSAPTPKSTHASNVFTRPADRRSVADNGDHRDTETEDLKAEVRQLLKRYSLDSSGDCPEVGLMHRRQSKDSSEPELSAKSAWIHPDQLAALKT
jgi:hypothetical protein